MPNNNNNMAKVKISKPSATTVKKDNTRVARTRVNELVGDKPNYMYFYPNKPTKADSLKYEKGFRDQILKDKIAGKSTYKETLAYGVGIDGRIEAHVRRGGGEYPVKEILNKKAMVRDSSIPLAPTQYPE